jgi:hypothetical protein
MDNNAKLVLVGAGCGLAGLILGASLFSGAPSANSKAAIPSTSSAAAAGAPADVEIILPEPVPPPAAPASDWRVTEKTDPMTDQTVKTACVTSSNEVYLSSPYGPRSAQLCIRQHPEFGRDVYLSLNGSGQILCRSYDNCTIPIRFDDGAVQRFTGNEPSDNSSETVFVANDGRFITSAKAASRIRVQLEFYQNGNQTFDFAAKGLEW